MKKILLAVLLSAALFTWHPYQNHPVNNSESKAAVTQTAKQPRHTAVHLATSVKQVETPAPQTQVTQIPTITPGSHEDWANQSGISPEDFGAVDFILSHESGWCATKSEGEIGIGCPAYHGFSKAGYGLCQSTPAIKMAITGDDWATNPVTQLKWCNAYAISRYGGWQAAYQHWLVFRNW